MPGKIKVKVLAGRNLPVMDRSGDTTDAYVELKFGNITFKTDVCRKSLNPQWNSEWYRFEVDDSELQDEPLQIRLMDHDTYSANDAIGKVYINLNPLLLPGVPPTVKNIWTLEAAMNTNTGSQSGSVMTGWIPVYDTMHGIRGEVNIIVKVELFSDFNKFRQSSCGVQFFYSPNIPHGYHTQSIHGFVEELVVSDDPEYKWIDKIRTPRASNEARQTLFFKLSGEVQRKIGLKALDLGGNAVIGYLQNFDLEGESGIVARGIGTAVTLVKLHDTLTFSSDNIEEAYFSQHKAQKECTGLNESMSLYSVSPANIPDPHIMNTRVTRKKHNLPYRIRALRSPKRIVRVTKYSCYELKGRKNMESSSEASSLKTASVSYPALTESVVQDASIRMMLALEDERGESSKKILNVRMRKLKRLFSSSDTDAKSSNPLLNTSARSSIVSTYNPYKEKLLKNDKAKTGVAALLIKTIHSVPLENVKEDNETSTTPTNNIKEHENQMKVDTGTSKIVKSEVKVKEEHDSSFEENTSTSNNLSDDSSLDSTSYNILNDTKFSTDEELEASNVLTKKLTRTNSFPQMRAKSLKIRLQNTDSDTCPLHESSTPTLFKCLSMNQISYDSEFSMNSRIKKNEHVGTMTANDVVSESIADSSELNKYINNKPLQCQQNIHSSQDSNFPLATSTPEEIRPPFFLETQSKFIIHPTDSEKCDTSKEYTVITIPENDENYILDNTEYDTSTDLNNTKHSDLLYADDSEVSVSAYSLLQSASDTESRDKKIMFKKIDEEVDNEKLEEQNISLSTQSLPSLKQFQVSTVESSAKEDMNSRVTIESKTSSSAESLIQSSSNEIYDVAHQNRQRRMLDLINIIDTKMMVQPEHLNHNSGGRFRMKKRDKIYKNFNPEDLRKTLYNQFLRKHIRNYKQAEVMHSYQFPLNESVPTSITPDSSSCNSSLENIIIQPHLCRTESYHLNEGFFTKRSTADLKFHEIAARELTADTPSSDSLKNNSGIIEMKQLKPNDTNISISPTSVDHAVHNSHSICNIEDVSSHNESTNITNTANSCVSYPSPNHRQQDEASLSPSYPLPAVPSMVSKICQLPTTKAQPTVSLHRRSSDSDLSITPKGNSFGTNDKSMTGLLKTSTAVIRTMNQDAFEMLEYPFITMQQYPPGFILHIGGLVSSRSVKLLERISNLEEPESRDSWWKEVRMEVRSHARALACNVVIGYREETSICDDVCVLNAYGTAAVINFHNPSQDSDNVFVSSKGQLGSGTNSAETEKAQQKSVPIKVEKSDTDTSVPTSANQTIKVRHISESKDHEVQFYSKCSLCHLAYNEASVPFRVNVSKCSVCKRARVPDVMFTTIELPDNLSTTGRGCIIQATACKAKKDLRGELNAKEISDCLPFLEYELHSLLLNKLKVKGMNAIFGLKLQVSVGERLIIGMAVGTAVFVTALPTPSIPQIASGNSWHKEEQLAEIQKTLVETVKQNREFYRLKPAVDVENGRVTTSDTDESDDELPDLDFSVGPRDTCVLEVDDIEDMDRISLLMDDRPPEDFHVVNTQTIPGLDELEIVRNLQMFTQISRTKIPAGQFASMPSKYFTKLLQSVYFKLRRMIPCALCDMQFKLALPEPDEIQFTVIGMALGLGDPVKMNKLKKKPMSHSVSKDQVKKSDDSDMIFNIDVDHTEISSDNASSNNFSSGLINTPSLKLRTRSPLRSKHQPIYKHKHVPLKGRYGVDITPLSYLPGGRIERYLGNLNFFFIRESTSIRENGGLSGFTHSFVMEVLAIVRAHITALGGNAMVAFFMTKCVLLHSPHKNQGQCLINVGGDVVSVSYFTDEKQGGASNC
uniref:C2 domain-containing protein 5 isoform X1 n=1 Tax=Osmia lignaria TaxID=473952 RepID=UPI001478A1F9|nr:C2 domain-containing protein 5 isoform X1 [Osmia lignaria]XP_034175182.1 C2 domain-containing protein 5 isoform X1 [Osmia lignaria]XP_034175183.1 C2 domain-containing protein 5 isoform X1 [Osmia lignaria]XP_034175184.1 C2 domain-containing protein 5 isoform X1 [Osmia lignaria]XP_034175185.1 C2 domain-containing protein 5 isoform X1 [Osmia lignaria]